jgi:hypothetical protein
LAEKTVVCYYGLEIDPLLSNERTSCSSQVTEVEQVAKYQKVYPLRWGDLCRQTGGPCSSGLQKIPTKRKVVCGSSGTPVSVEIKRKPAFCNRDVTFWGRVVEGVDGFCGCGLFHPTGVGGLALNQALFWEVPCIVSEADGTERDLVFESRTGYYFSSNDSNSLAEVIQRCLALPEDQKLAMGQSGRKGVIERSNVNQMVKTFLSSIGDLTLGYKPTFREKHVHTRIPSSELMSCSIWKWRYSHYQHG